MGGSDRVWDCWATRFGRGAGLAWGEAWVEGRGLEGMPGRGLKDGEWLG